MSKRRDAVRSFKVIDISLPPAMVPIPTNPIRRRFFYNLNGGLNSELPRYELFKRRNLEPEDLHLLVKPWYIVFEYKEKKYRFEVKQGAVTDIASVPTPAVHGNLTKRGYGVLEAALIHDFLFALRLFSFEDANNIFEAMLKWLGVKSRVTIAFYMLGVRSPVGAKLYKSSDVNKHWLRDYYNLYRLNNNLHPVAMIQSGASVFNITER